MINFKNKKIILFSFFIFICAITCFFLFFYFKRINTPINILFSTDRAYQDYTKVAITSAILNKKKTSKYNIYVICGDMTEEERNLFHLLETDNVKLFPVPVKVDDISFVSSELTRKVNASKVDLFKFFFPQMFPNLDKILYLDSDTLVLKDLSELFNRNISNYYLAAEVKYTKYPKLPTNKDKYEYIYNAGVLLLNLDKMRKDNITEKLLEAKKQDKYKDYYTQKVFNVVMVPEKIYSLYPIYNNEFTNIKKETWKNTYKVNKNYFCQHKLCLVTPTFDEFNKKSVIIHFAGVIKPWKTQLIKEELKNNNIQDTRLYYIKLWWKYAEKVNQKAFKNFNLQNLTKPF